MVFPAHAGVILEYDVGLGSFYSFSRTRGGDPDNQRVEVVDQLFFPHTRV